MNGSPNQKNYLEKIQSWFEEKGIDSVLQPEDLDDFGDESPTALLLGGDGFITRSGHELAKRDIPFLGINFGTVGFLATTEPEDWKEAVEKILLGHFKIDEKKILKGSLEGEDFYAVNDIVLHRGLEKFVRMRVEVDGYALYEDVGGDGMIVSSAIGSTAYSLAAGGPVVESGLVVTPIAVHRMDVKPLPLKEDRVVDIICLGGSYDSEAEYVLEVDGNNSRTRRVKEGDRIKVQYSDEPVIKFIVPEGAIFIKALHKKLGLAT